MSDINWAEMEQAASHAKSLAKKLQGVLQVADVLEQIHSLKQAHDEAKSAAQTAYGEATEAKTVLAGLRMECENADAELDTARDDLKDAHAEAVRVISGADTEAKAIVDVAKAEARKLVLNVVNQVKAENDKLAHAHQAHATFMEESVAVEKTAQKKMDAVLAELAAVKKRLG